jgi:hypothetical protein
VIDFLSWESQFADHLAAVWLALPETERGHFYTERHIIEHARSRGVPAELWNPAQRGGPALVASYGDIKRARISGRTRIAYIEHGAGQAYRADPKGAGNSSYAGGRDRADVGLFLVPNHYSADAWRHAYPHARIEVVGCPKLDTLPAREPGPGPVVAMAWHWDCRLVQETRTAFYTYRPMLEALKARFTLIGHGHPRAMTGPPDLPREYRRRDIELVTDFAEVCRRADLLIFDNTSAGFEFASTGRPVVVVNDPVGRQPRRGYRKEVDHGLRFWDAAGVGLNVWRPEDLPGAIERALADPPELREARERALEIVYPVRSGAAQRAARAVAEWAADSIEVAA